MCFVFWSASYSVSLMPKNKERLIGYCSIVKRDSPKTSEQEALSIICIEN